jgi:N-acetylglucosaminyl-diphospho-decaprenol L-rhamnosyltransferase
VRPAASLVIIAYGDPALLGTLLRTLGEGGDSERFTRIVVVDNGFPAGGDSRRVPVPDRLRPHIVYVQNLKRSYASGVNAGVAATDTPIVCVSNNDVFWRPGFSIAPLLEVLAGRPDIGVVGPQLEFPDGRWQASASPFPSIAERLRSLLMIEIGRNWLASRRHPAAGSPRSVDCVSGAFFVVRRELFDLIGGYDETYPFYGEDTEFNWQVRARGLARLVVPAARLVHVRGASAAPATNTTSSTRLHQSNIRFVARHQGPAAARAYRGLTRLLAAEIELLYRIAHAARPGEVAARRLTVARLSRASLDALPVDVLAPLEEL